MLIDGLILAEGSSATNLSVSTGAAFPVLAIEGELFYRNDGANEGLYSYDGAAWKKTSADAVVGGSGITVVGNVVSNAGVTSIVAGTGITISGSIGAVTINATATPSSLPASLIGFGSASNVLSGSSTFTWDNTNNILRLGGTGFNGLPALITPNGATYAGTFTIKGGYASSGTSGNLVLTGGDSVNYSPGGALSLVGGNGWSAGSGGPIVMSTSEGTTAVQTERFRITGNGAWSVGTAGTATGTSGQVLTSTGSTTAPTWQTAVVATTSLSNITTAGDGTTTAVIQGPQSTGTSGSLTIRSGLTSAGLGGNVSIYGYQSSAAAGAGGTAAIYGGAGGATSGAGGAASIQAGNSYGSTVGSDVSIIGGVQAGTGIAGNVLLRGGVNGTGGVGGSVIIQTAVTGFSPIERFRVLNNGAWSVGTTGTATGTSGQVLTSNGNAAPTWSTPALPSGSLSFGSNYTELRSDFTAIASSTIDCSLANNFNLTMSASITTLAFSNIPVSGRVYNMVLYINQDATGSRTIVWPASVKFSGGVPPVLTTTPNKTDIITLATHDGGASWFGFIAGQNF